MISHQLARLLSNNSQDNSIIQSEIIWGETRFTTLVRHGRPKNRLDMAIIGDGYTTERQDMFQDDVDEIVDAFRQIEPMATYIKHSNFHRINVNSKEEGAKDRYLSPPTASYQDLIHRIS